MTNVSIIARILNTVKVVPPGFVASYGQVADLSGLPGRARLVGKQLTNTFEGAAIPWHRIVRSDGKIAFPVGSEKAEEQRQRLIAEGVVVRNNRISMKRFQWQPDLAEILHTLKY
ncbi:MGMT family protein [Aestuariibacter sp. A3R04]|uniref:MGMT family protein n=1 Tax=Aestuariibacter sp. A3R04 TaxID=2841571 RepID=UPI001C084BD1|nr:MGMT family protein [Aestuariibacter sp. A3R04]MBU3020238.1 MGMT family protein [Aestuariibacter sp. A3R04]